MMSEKGLCKILKQAYKQGGGDPAVNVGLFDADEDVPMMGRCEK